MRYGDEKETEFVRSEAMRLGTRRETRREKQRRERGRTVMSTSIGHKKSKHNYCYFSTAIHSLARLRTLEPQAHTGIDIEGEKSKCH